MKELNSYDKTVVKNIEEQFEEVRDAKGVLVRPESNTAQALYGTVSLATEEFLKSKGYTVENKTPFCVVTK